MSGLADQPTATTVSPASPVTLERLEQLDPTGGTVRLTIDRPPLNVLDLATIALLREAFTELAADPTLRLLVVAGAGERAFSAGVAVQDHTPDKIEQLLGGFHEVCRILMDLPAITVAAVAGHCLGGGMELAAACDLVYADDSARFAQPEIQLGCYPPLAAALYPRWLGAGRTLELLATGRALDAAEAEALGFVTRRVETGGLEAAITELAGSLAGKSLPVLRLTKRAVAAGRDLPYDQALAESERLYIEELAGLEDLEEGVAAFLDKRPPVWRHR